MSKFVTIQHPDLPDQYPLVTERSYRLTWKAKGWRIKKSTTKSSKSAKPKE